MHYIEKDPTQDPAYIAMKRQEKSARKWRANKAAFKHAYRMKKRKLQEQGSNSMAT